MVEYSVLFATKITAKNKEDLYRKADIHAEQMTKCLRKPVYAYQYGELEVKKTVKQTTLDDD